ncbi:hypothetical protein pEaSNUABM37_00010 [Erwinia phage pEa_SNUABM_37]|nr:hypothetical protein pEaSNUABM37_00010 [Erwinia phage pEa_SNUABM_37]QXO10480.1 hypothetical protein pEaSNUABM48_00010 [Erwinia phage pEa_SNUABM_48]
MTLQNIIHKRINDLMAPAFNKAFGTNLKFTDFDFVSVRPNTAQGATKDTKGILRAVEASKAYTGQREVSYNRLDAQELFYGIPKFIELAANEMDEYSVVGYLSKRYGLELDVNYVEAVTLGQGYVEVAFADTSPIIKGKVRFNYYLSSIDLNELIADPLVGALHTPEISAAANISLYSYPLDLTFVKYDIEGMIVNSNAPLALAEVLNAVTGDPWTISAQSGDYNLGEAKLVFQGLSSEANSKGYPANTHYPKCAIYRLSNLCTNFSGLLLVNMY